MLEHAPIHFVLLDIRQRLVREAALGVFGPGLLPHVRQLGEDLVRCLDVGRSALTRRDQLGLEPAVAPHTVSTTDLRLALHRATPHHALDLGITDNLVHGARRIPDIFRKHDLSALHEFLGEARAVPVQRCRVVGEDVGRARARLGIVGGARDGDWREGGEVGGRRVRRASVGGWKARRGARDTHCFR